MIKGKKGQFYIFLSLILLAYIATLRPSLDTQVLERSAFTRAQENFMTESAVVINSALFDEVSVTERLDAYVEDYIDYQAVQGLNVTLMYVLSHNEVLYLRNFHKDALLIVGDETYNFDVGSQLEITKTGSIEINATGYEYYTVEIDTDKPIDFQTVFKVI